MDARTFALAELYSELIGPRYGPFEQLPLSQDPRSEYVLGLLSPIDSSKDADSAAAVSAFEFGTDEGSSEEDNAQDELSEAGADPSAPYQFNPTLDPTRIPSTFGLSFVINSMRDAAQINIYVTWARYGKTQDGWQRTPFETLHTQVDCTPSRVLSEDRGLRLSIRSVAVETGTRVSLFAENISPADDVAKTVDFIFQPQIRVNLASGLELRPLDAVKSKSSRRNRDEQRRIFFYRDHRGYGRGHLCSVIWKSIDPERSYTGENTPDRPPSGPFSFSPASKLAPDVVKSFSAPDIRTEFMPSVALGSPAFGWREAYGHAPILDPNELAELCDGQQLKKALEPLVGGYQRWINEVTSKAAALDNEEFQIFANENIASCEVSLERINAGITFLAENENARLAFLFANKAIALQAEWSRGKCDDWRVFQIAFVLQCVKSVAQGDDAERDICDLLYFPTGGGKTEAYLCLMAFIVAYRARQKPNEQFTRGGVAVLSRYTLRLLAGQQFRRALSLITACEVLRVRGLGQLKTVGWRPQGFDCAEGFIWGSLRFAIGLWVGGSSTPNSLISREFADINGRFAMTVGAVDQLYGVTTARAYTGSNAALATRVRGKRLIIEGEPAQVLACPCCSAILGIPKAGISGKFVLHYPLAEAGQIRTSLKTFQSDIVDSVEYNLVSALDGPSLRIAIATRASTHLSDWQIDDLVSLICQAEGCTIAAFRGSRPGYFPLSYANANREVDHDFSIICPDPDCGLNRGTFWAEQVPVATEYLSSDNVQRFGTISSEPHLPAIQSLQWQNVQRRFRHGGSPALSTRIPIPALTVDDQIYKSCPCVVLSTVDKLARLPFRPLIANLFGNVSAYHSRWGYYRPYVLPNHNAVPGASPRAHPPGLSANMPLWTSVKPFAPPDLFIQDELHLLDGSLGSIVGAYETVVDELASYGLSQRIRPKYIASTATISHASEQVRALFNRRLAIFPEPALSPDDRFFAYNEPLHQLDAASRGRLFVGAAFPGKGVLTPNVRIWSSLLQSGYVADQLGLTLSDGMYTLVGYFNAIRELASGSTLYRQDVPERMKFRFKNDYRQILEYVELSGRRNSLDLPSLLDQLAVTSPNAVDLVLATSMFGTGVDVDRLGLMVIHGQPKGTATYIQAAGRVGRRNGAMVFSLLRATRPRDLAHYEYFASYHTALDLHVEPITVTPFAPRSRERTLGPLAVALLRNGREIRGQVVPGEFAIEQRLAGNTYYSKSRHMAARRQHGEVKAVAALFESRAASQPVNRAPISGVTAAEMASELDRWYVLSRNAPDDDTLLYSESAMLRSPTHDVVLGDTPHQIENLACAFETVQATMRDVEDTIGFQI